MGKNKLYAMEIRLVNEKDRYNITGDFKRAYWYNKNISNEINKRFDIRSGAIREIKFFGPWEGLNTEEVLDKYRDGYLTWNKEPDKIRNMDGSRNSGV